MRTNRLLPKLLALALLLLAAPQARADQTDPTLRQLFEDLKSTDSDFEARALEAQIWAIWTQAPTPAASRLMAQGLQQLAANDPEAALETFTKLTQAAPKFAEAWNKRATVLYLLGRYQDSIDDIGQTLALEPHHFGALSGLAMCDAELHQTQNALNALTRALAVDPRLSGAKENLNQLKKQLAKEST
jgi:tetratricopeptide (TPR) repeat protein